MVPVKPMPLLRSRKPRLLLLVLLLLVLVLQCLCVLVSSASAPKSHTAPEEAHTTIIPFDYDPILMPYIVVQASINGQPPLPFIVDTGSVGQYLQVEPGAAKTLGLPSLRPSKYQFVKGQGQRTVICTLINKIRIIGVGNNNDLTNIFKNEFYNTKEGLQADTPFQIVDILSSLSNNLHGPLPVGIISLNLLQTSKMVWQIDFQHKHLIFICKEEHWKPTSDSFVVPIRQDTSTGLYDLSATVAPDHVLNFAIDSGSPISCVQNMAALPLSNAQSARAMNIMPDRRRLLDTVLLPQLDIGSLDEPNLVLYETSPGTATATANLLGLNFLSRFLVTFDFAGNKMYLQRRSDYARLIVSPGRSGVRLGKNGMQIKAAWVEPGSPAELAGLHIGQQIEQVDWQALGTLPLSEAQNILDGFQGMTANLVVRTAAEKEAEIHFTRLSQFFGWRHALLGVSLDWVQNNLMVDSVRRAARLTQCSSSTMTFTSSTANRWQR